MSNHHKTRTRDVKRLVEASRAGDRSAFDELVRLYQRRTTYLAVRLLGNADDATEIVQQAFVTAYLKIDKLRDPGRFESWLLKIISNLAINHRDAIRHRMSSIEAMDCETKKSISPFENEIKAELEQAVQRAMLRLSGKEAKAISLFGFEDLSHKVPGTRLPASFWIIGH